MNIQAVVFDMDGIIFDSEKLVLKCWQVVADKYNVPDIEKSCRDCLGLNRTATKEYFQNKYGKDFPYDEYKKEMSDLFHEKAAGGKLEKKPGIEELLIFLKERKMKLAVASSTRREIVEEELRDGGLFSYFDVIIAGDMVKNSKPEPDIYLKACECLKVTPKEAYAIEDSFNGIRSAHAAGMHPIMVPDMAEPEEEIRNLCECVLENHFAVKEYLDFL